MNAAHALQCRLLATAMLGLSPLAQAGVVEVSFQTPEQFADAGRGSDAEPMRAALTQHLQTLGREGLPATQTLRITVTDIDLAGELRPNFRGLTEVRVLRGRADWPRISLRYSLSEGERILNSGEARLSDMSYLQSPVRNSAGAWPYEVRMLSRWFSSTFGNSAAH